MSFTLQDVLNLTNDYLGNYTTGNIETAQKYRAINSSIDFIKRRLGLPSDETYQTVLFSSDQIYYDLDSDVNEAFLLKYSNDFYNTPMYFWDYMQDVDMLKRAGNNLDKRWSITNINGRKQLMLLGSNIKGGDTIDPLEEIGDWIVTNDGSSLVLDTNIKQAGAGSLKTTVAYSAGTVTFRNTNLNLDLSDLFENSGMIKLYCRSTNANITNFKLKIFTDSSNYVTITVSVDDAGNTFVANSFFKVGFKMDEAVETLGTLDKSNITRIDIDVTIPSGFSSGYIWIDNIFTTFPDELELGFYSSYKGTDSTGATQKTTLNVITDIVGIGNMYNDFIDIIARKAALILFPQLRGDKEYYSVFVTDFNDMLRTLSRTFPRKRLQGSSQHYIQRN